MADHAAANARFSATIGIASHAPSVPNRQLPAVGHRPVTCSESCRQVHSLIATRPLNSLSLWLKDAVLMHRRLWPRRFGVAGLPLYRFAVQPFQPPRNTSTDGDGKQNAGEIAADGRDHFRVSRRLHWFAEVLLVHL